MLQRLLLKDLVSWKRQATRKPVLLDGARQVGKSWLIDKLFGPDRFRKVHKLDFRSESGLAGLFAESLDPGDILSNIELHLNQEIDIEQDLIFFDEVGECQRAIDSLKYFAEQLPQAFVCASGSNIGLIDSFPVGKVQQLELFPLCFEEFLMAADQPRLLQAFQEQQKSQTIHQLLWSQLLDFYFVGGMPEAVTSWFRGGGSTHERTQNISRIHQDLITGYKRDFGKYAGKYHAQHIEAIFQNVPRQLAASQDDSVQRYKFKDVIAKKQRYRELQGPINWLEKARLVWKCHPIDGRPEVPLMTRARANMFKLYLFDVGLLGHMLDMTYADQINQGTSYKGYIAENFVLTELRTHIGYPLYSWEQARAEVEFLHRCADGEVIPVEVKSGKRTKARSLRSYMDRYKPSRAIKLIGGLGGKTDGALEVWPLYYAQYLRDL